MIPYDMMQDYTKNNEGYEKMSIINGMFICWFLMCFEDIWQSRTEFSYS